MTSKLIQGLKRIVVLYFYVISHKLHAFFPNISTIANVLRFSMCSHLAGLV